MSSARLGPCRPKTNDRRLAARQSDVPAAAWASVWRHVAGEHDAVFADRDAHEDAGLRPAQRRRGQARRLPGPPRPIPATAAAADRSAPPRGRRCRRNGCRTRRSGRGTRPSACTSCRERRGRDRRSGRRPSGRAASRGWRPRRRRATASRTADRRPRRENGRPCPRSRSARSACRSSASSRACVSFSASTARCSGVMFFRRSASWSMMCGSSLRACSPLAVLLKLLPSPGRPFPLPT